MEEKFIEYDGKKINLKNISNEELLKLRVKLKKDEKEIRNKISKIMKKYPFLKKGEK